MSVMDRPKADNTITMRLPAQTRELIDRAAATLDKSRTEFVLESARARAIDVLLDQRVFHLDEAATEAFARALHGPPAPVEALRRLMQSRAPWEQVREPLHRRLYSAPAPITADHRLDRFDCGKPVLDEWLRAHALENEGTASRTFVVTGRFDEDAGEVLAYYALAYGSVVRTEIPRRLRHGLPNPVPVMVLGRLAVDRRHAGNGLGRGLLREAMQRTLQASQIAGLRALIVHAIDDEAAAFYGRYGFQVFPAGSLTLFLPLETLRDAIVS